MPRWARVTCRVPARTLPLKSNDSVTDRPAWSAELDVRAGAKVVLLRPRKLLAVAGPLDHHLPTEVVGVEPRDPDLDRAAERVADRRGAGGRGAPRAERLVEHVGEQQTAPASMRAPEAAGRGRRRALDGPPRGVATSVQASRAEPDARGSRSSSTRVRAARCGVPRARGRPAERVYRLGGRGRGMGRARASAACSAGPRLAGRALSCQHSQRAEPPPVVAHEARPRRGRRAGRSQHGVIRSQVARPPRMNTTFAPAAVGVQRRDDPLTGS